MPGQLVYLVRFNSDFHRGSGLSVPGVVDAAIDRDSKGFPRLLGTTIKGLARDGARRALTYLGERFPDEYSAMREVFGRPASDDGTVAAGWARSRGSSQPGMFFFLPAVLPAAGRELDGLQRLMTERRHHNQVDQRLGKVVEDFFFSREVGRRELEFLGRVTWDHTPGRETLGLLGLSLKMIESLGGKRSRGEGDCRFEWLSWESGCRNPAREPGRETAEALPEPGGSKPFDADGAVESFIDAFVPSAEPEQQSARTEHP